MVFEPVKRPTDHDVFWLNDHCSPGTLDRDELCGGCGETHGDCAQKCTESIALLNSVDCGSSGFWCPKCNRFYAQDVCGETPDDEMECVDGSRLTLVDGWIRCACGEALFMPIE